MPASGAGHRSTVDYGSVLHLSNIEDLYDERLNRLQ
jgi:hypothetical protein